MCQLSSFLELIKSSFCCKRQMQSLFLDPIHNTFERELHVYWELSLSSRKFLLRWLADCNLDTVLLNIFSCNLLFKTNVQLFTKLITNNEANSQEACTESQLYILMNWIFRNLHSIKWNMKFLEKRFLDRIFFLKGKYLWYWYLSRQWTCLRVSLVQAGLCVSSASCPTYHNTKVFKGDVPLSIVLQNKTKQKSGWVAKDME